MTSSSVTFGQGYPLWLAAAHAGASDIRIGRVIGWTDRAPLVVWKSTGSAGTRRLTAPDVDESWWLGDTEAAAYAEAQEALKPAGGSAG